MSAPDETPGEEPEAPPTDEPESAADDSGVLNEDDVDVNGRRRPPVCKHGVEPLRIELRGGMDYEWRVGSDPRDESVESGPVCVDCLNEELEVERMLAEQEADAEAARDVQLAHDFPHPPTIIAGEVDTRLLQEDPLAWAEIREAALDACAAAGLVVDEERMTRLASLSPTDLLHAIGIAEHTSNREILSREFLLHVLVAHLLHLRNRERHFAYYRPGVLRWMNVWGILHGPMGAGKGNSLDFARDRLCPGLGLTYKSAGRATVQGLVGTIHSQIVKGEVVTEMTRGLFEEAQDGVVAYPEFSLLTQGRPDDVARTIAELAELASGGTATVTLAGGRREISSWTILLGAVQPGYWDSELFERLGLRRRFAFHVLENLPPNEAADEYRHAAVGGQPDIAAYAVLDAKLRALRTALDHVAEFDFGPIRAWIEDGIRHLRLNAADEAVYQAIAVASYLAALPKFTSLQGTVLVPLNTVTSQAMLEQVGARVTLFTAADDREVEAVRAVVEEILKPGQAIILSQLKRLVAARIGSSARDVADALSDMIVQEKGQPASDERPLVAVDRQFATEWNATNKFEEIPGGSRFNRSLVVVWYDAANALGFDAARTKVSDERRKNRPKPWMDR